MVQMLQWRLKLKTNKQTNGWTEANKQEDGIKTLCLRSFDLGHKNIAFEIQNVNHDLTMGLINLSNFGGFRVNPSPTYVTFVTILFQPFPVK